jgi:hypothetical protein
LILRGPDVLTPWAGITAAIETPEDRRREIGDIGVCGCGTTGDHHDRPMV